jgi:hypothetical protein
MKNENLYQEEIEEESIDSEEEEEEEEEEEDDEIIDLNEFDLSMNKSSISMVKANIDREDDINNNNDALEKKMQLESTRNIENDSSNKVQNGNNLSNNQNNTGQVSIINAQQTTKIEERPLNSSINIISGVNNARDLKNIDISNEYFM